MALTAARREAIWHGLRETTPSPLTELEYSSPYELLVAVTLSAQATDKSVNLATRKLFPVANTPQQIHALGVAGLTPYVRSIGLYNAKAANVVAAARILIDQHDGQVPRERAALEALTDPVVNANRNYGSRFPIHLLRIKRRGKVPVVDVPLQSQHFEARVAKSMRSQWAH